MPTLHSFRNAKGRHIGKILCTWLTRETSIRAYLIALLAGAGVNIDLQASISSPSDSGATHPEFSISPSAMRSLHVDQVPSDHVIDCFFGTMKNYTGTEFVYHLTMNKNSLMSNWPLFEDEGPDVVNEIIMPLKDSFTLSWGYALITKNCREIPVYDVRVRARTFQALFPRVLQFANMLGMKHSAHGWSRTHKITERLDVDFSNLSMPDASPLICYQIYHHVHKGGPIPTAVPDFARIRTWLKKSLQHGLLDFDAALISNSVQSSAIVAPSITMPLCSLVPWISRSSEVPRIPSAEAAPRAQVSNARSLPHATASASSNAHHANDTALNALFVHLYLPWHYASSCRLQ